MISDKIAFAIVSAAKAAGIEPAALLAIVEIEADGGKPFEQDGRTPCFLYERHVAWKEAAKAGCLPAFRAAGLAIEHWSKSTQYKDQGTSANRLALMHRAEMINIEVAHRSASWGLGQTMGFLAEKLGYESAAAMVVRMQTVAGQIDGMVREIHSSHLVEPLNAHDWPHVARIYNGAGYAANSYDTRLASAYERWSRKLDVLMPGGVPRIEPPEQSLSTEQVRNIQEWLRAKGYHEVGSPDGLWGTRTTGAVSAFQAHEGLPVTGHWDADTAAAFNVAEPRPVPQARADATPGDLKSAGSKTVAHADNTGALGKVIAAGGVAGAAGNSGALDKVKDLADQAGAWHEALDSLSGALSWAAQHWWLAAIAAGAVIAWRSRAIIAARIADHRSGVHAGPS